MFDIPPQIIYYLWAGFFTSLSSIAVIFAFVGGKVQTQAEKDAMIEKTLLLVMVCVLLGSILAYLIPAEITAELAWRSIIIRLPSLIAILVSVRAIWKMRLDGK